MKGIAWAGDKVRCCSSSADVFDACNPEKAHWRGTIYENHDWSKGLKEG